MTERSIRVALDGYSSMPAGVPQETVLSATLFLLHIKDLHVSPGTIGYADDSTGADRYLASVNARTDVTATCPEAMVHRLNVALQAVPD